MLKATVSIDINKRAYQYTVFNTSSHTMRSLYATPDKMHKLARNMNIKYITPRDAYEEGFYHYRCLNKE